jgi:hypothetical protein
MANNPNTKVPNNKKPPMGMMPPRLGFWNMVIMSILMFLLIIGVYAQFSTREDAMGKASISGIATDLQKGNIRHCAVYLFSFTHDVNSLVANSNLSSKKAMSSPSASNCIFVISGI